MEKNKHNILGPVISSINLPFSLCFRHSHGEKYLHTWRVFPAVILPSILYGIIAGFSNYEEIEGTRSVLLLVIFFLSAAFVYVNERLKLIAKEKKGEHTISTYSGTPRFLPLNKASWFVAPVLFIFVALYDWEYFHWMRPFSLFMGVYGVVGVLENVISLCAKRSMTLELRDNDLLSKMQSAEKREFEGKNSTKENKTDDLINLFS